MTGGNCTHDGPLHTITNKRWSEDLTVLYKTASNKKTWFGKKDK